MENKNKPTTKPTTSGFSSDYMISFGNFIRDNYYVAGTPKLLSYNPQKYPHAKIDDIFVYWCIQNNK